MKVQEVGGGLLSHLGYLLQPVTAGTAKGGRTQETWLL